MTAEQISCENLWIIGKTCWIKSTDSIINSSYTTIIKTVAEITKLEFNHNKKIFFLPVEVAFSFPNLVTYSALNCSIKTIAKIHFKNLKMLESLDLKKNQIEVVRSNTFEDLSSLKNLDLRE